jgi:hypothetical protein
MAIRHPTGKIHHLEALMSVIMKMAKPRKRQENIRKTPVCSLADRTDPAAERKGGVQTWH